jgi:integrase
MTVLRVQGPDVGRGVSDKACRFAARWPAPDRCAWNQAMRPAGLLTAGGAGSRWSQATRNIRAEQWTRFLQFLARIGELVPEEPPGERLTPERLGRFILGERARISANTVWTCVRQLAAAIAAMAPARDWSWVVRHPAWPSAAQAHAARRIPTLADPTSLVAAVLHRCDQIAALPPSRSRSVAFRDGVLIALTAWAALRKKNLAEMTIGQHLRRELGQMRIVFDASLKNREIIDSPLPEFLVPYVTAYLDRHRPALLRGAPDPGALWISLRGGPLSYGEILHAFRQTSRRLIGVPMTVHACRTALASSLLRQDPRALGLAGAALAHRSVDTTLRFYAQGGAKAANRHWLRLLREQAHGVGGSR